MRTTLDIVRRLSSSCCRESCARRATHSDYVHRSIGHAGTVHFLRSNSIVARRISPSVQRSQYRSDSGEIPCRRNTSGRQCGVCLLKRTDNASIYSSSYRHRPDFDLTPLTSARKIVRELLDDGGDLRRRFSDTFISHFNPSKATHSC